MTSFLLWMANRVALRDEEGQGMVEYSLVLAIITVGIVVILNAIGVEVESIFTNVKDELQGVTQ